MNGFDCSKLGGEWSTFDIKSIIEKISSCPSDKFKEKHKDLKLGLYS